MAATEMSAWERFDRFTTRFMDRAIVVMMWIMIGAGVVTLMLILVMIVLSIRG